MLDWMLQQDDYIGQASLLMSCYPGVPPLGPLNEVNSVLNASTTVAVSAVSNVNGAPETPVSNTVTIVNGMPSVLEGSLLPNILPAITDTPGEMPAGPIVANPGKDLTVSTAVTVTSAGCFNPEACPTISTSRALTANSASADFISQTVKPLRPATTIFHSELGDTMSTADRALPLPFTIGDQAFTPHPVGFSIDGTTISAGGRDVTITGIPIRLETSGVLRISTGIISIANIASTSGHSGLTTYVADTPTITPNPTTFAVASTTISAGGAAITNPKTPVSLEVSRDRGTGINTLTSTPKHPLKTSGSPSGGDNNPIERKRLGALFVMYLIYRIIAVL